MSMLICFSVFELPYETNTAVGQWILLIDGIIAK